ncbi:protein of unknown function [Candidatus Methylomirabilis oxygeniifera]|uniref:Uncharacterized protein n=1 Tax=Methylomirabilis oxygeniifera TaxID=671143 RepID=D5ML40_METO1|nr:protein of unknown function [Candidatus Methylomirabilis oxyfera]
MHRFACDDRVGITHVPNLPLESLPTPYIKTKPIRCACRTGKTIVTFLQQDTWRLESGAGPCKIPLQ